MQEFNFPYDLAISSFLVFLISFFIVVIAVCWLGGYFYQVRDPYGREDRLAGLKRANLWAKVAGCIGFFTVVITCLAWKECFYRLDLYSDNTVRLWFSYSKVKVVTISRAEIDSIHFGLVKGGSDCYLHIQLKNGKSYDSTLGRQCRNAFQALTQASNTK